MTTTIKPELQHRPNKDGLHRVHIYIRHHGIKRHPKLDLHVKKSQFNPETRRVQRHPRAQHINDYLESIVSEAETLLREARMKKQVVTIDDLVKIVKGPGQEQSHDFVEYIQNYVALKYDPVHNFGQIKSFNTLIANLNEYHTKPVSIYAVNTTYIINLSNWMKAKPLKPSSIRNLMTKIKQVLKFAKNDSNLDYNIEAFAEYNAPMIIKEEKREHLTDEEINRLIHFKGTKKQEIARDSFLLQYYLGGARVSDAITITNRNFLVDCFYFMQKSKMRNKKMAITHHDKLNDLVSKYLNPDKLDDPILPYMRRYQRGTLEFEAELKNAPVKINWLLRTIAKKSRINIHLTSHVARKTYINLVNDLLGKEVAQAIAGHASFNTTEKYIRLRDMHEEAIRAVF